jgi:hypothetical protein
MHSLGVFEKIQTMKKNASNACYTRRQEESLLTRK